MTEQFQQPWSWYVCGILLGLTVALLLIIGNKRLGVSSSLRDMCAAILPASRNPFRKNWNGDVWNLFFVSGIVFGGMIAAVFLSGEGSVAINAETRKELSDLGVRNFDGLLPSDLFSFDSVLSLKGFLILGVGGFLVGFGTNSAGGCTSGHTIAGLSTLQWPSLLATVCFMAGGLVATHFLLPLLFTVTGGL